MEQTRPYALAYKAHGARVVRVEPAALYDLDRDLQGRDGRCGGSERAQDEALHLASERAMARRKRFWLRQRHVAIGIEQPNSMVQVVEIDD
jgi:hypothetical protein